MKIADSFIKCYPVSKTLQFKLIPMFKTEENLNKFNIVSVDEEKSKKYVLAKPILDKCHKQYISDRLGSFNCDWKMLYEELLNFQKTKESATYEKVKEEYQKAISKHLKSGSGYAELKPKAIIDSVVKDKSATYVLSDEEKDVLKTFNRFATYFEGYRQTRENIYSFGIASSIAYRIIEDNFPKFVANIKLFESLSDSLKNELNEKLSPLLNGRNLLDVFDPDGFKSVLTQEGIDFYNTLLGGIAESETEKIQGLNELCNLAFQQKKLDKKIKFTALYKQILTDKDTISYLPTRFKTDKELLETVKEYSTIFFDCVDKYCLELKMEKSKRMKRTNRRIIGLNLFRQSHTSFNMENPLNITALNDFIFCPVSIYFHSLYDDVERGLFQSEYQINGTDAHKSVDSGTYSTSTTGKQGLSVYCEKYNLIGKIDLYYTDKRLLVERKKRINTIFDGYIFQLYAQYFAMKEMGYKIEKLKLYSMDDNKSYPIELPENNPEMHLRFEILVSNINSFNFDDFTQNNSIKCEHCIYEPYCDRSAKK